MSGSASREGVICQVIGMIHRGKVSVVGSANLDDSHAGSTGVMSQAAGLNVSVPCSW